MQNILLFYIINNMMPTYIKCKSVTCVTESDRNKEKYSKKYCYSQAQSHKHTHTHMHAHTHARTHH